MHAALQHAGIHTASDWGDARQFAHRLKTQEGDDCVRPAVHAKQVGFVGNNAWINPHTPCVSELTSVWAGPQLASKTIAGGQVQAQHKQDRVHASSKGPPLQV